MPQNPKTSVSIRKLQARIELYNHIRHVLFIMKDQRKIDPDMYYTLLTPIFYYISELENEIGLLEITSQETTPKKD